MRDSLNKCAMVSTKTWDITGRGASPSNSMPFSSNAIHTCDKRSTVNWELQSTCRCMNTDSSLRKIRRGRTRSQNGHQALVSRHSKTGLEADCASRCVGTTGWGRAGRLPAPDHKVLQHVAACPLFDVAPGGRLLHRCGAAPQLLRPQPRLCATAALSALSHAWRRSQACISQHLTLM